MFNVRVTLSIDAPLREEQGNTLLDVLPARDDETPDRQLLELSVKCDLQRMLHSLRPREAEVLCLWSGLGDETPLTLEDIGHRFGITRERVRQIRNDALEKLRHRYVAADC